MSGYLLDTSVVSAFSPSGRGLTETANAWFEKQERSSSLFISSIVIAEIETGTQKLRRLGATARADQFERWLDRLVLQFGQRILDTDTRVARIAGRLADKAAASGSNPGLADVLIAATAIAHDMTILTINVRHFAVLGVPHLNPFADQLPSG